MGKVTNGLGIVRMAHQGSEVTVVPNPSRIMSIGMTQAEAGEFLAAAGMVQKRTGLKDDDAIVAEQEPELTMEMRPGSEVETLGIRRDQVVLWGTKESPVTSLTSAR